MRSKEAEEWGRRCEKVRNESLTELVRESGVELTPKGRTLVGGCPFHKAHRGVFYVNEKRGFYCCFGCNSAGFDSAGTAINFVMLRDGCTFREALEKLEERMAANALLKKP